MSYDDLCDLQVSPKKRVTLAEDDDDHYDKVVFADADGDTPAAEAEVTDPFLPNGTDVPTIQIQAGDDNNLVIVINADMAQALNADVLTAVGEISRPKTRRELAVIYARKILVFLFSTAGMSCLLVFYVGLGGIIFLELEGPGENLRRQGAADRQNETVLHLWRLLVNVTELNATDVSSGIDLGDGVVSNISCSNTTQGGSKALQMNDELLAEWQEKARQIINKYTIEVYETGADEFNTDPENVPKWNYPNSLLYSMTIITTVGKWLIVQLCSFPEIINLFISSTGDSSIGTKNWRAFTIICQWSAVGFTLGKFYSLNSGDVHPKLSLYIILLRFYHTIH
jgi:hypothetical protein